MSREGEQENCSSSLEHSLHIVFCAKTFELIFVSLYFFFNFPKLSQILPKLLSFFQNSIKISLSLSKSHPKFGIIFGKIGLFCSLLSNFHTQVPGILLAFPQHFYKIFLNDTKNCADFLENS